MPKIPEMIKNAAEILSRSGIAEPNREARSLLALALKKDRTFLIAHPEYELSIKEEKIFRKFIERRARREPFQHIAGRQEFWGLDFFVNGDAMIPRPETELIVEAGIEILQNLDNPHFCEIGTGSGCITVSILHSLKKATAVGLDISAKALQVTEKNAGTHNVSERLEVKISDVFGALEKGEKFDLIVSNPPYVPSEDVPTLQAEVRDFDPIIALTDGKDGLSIIRKIIEDAPEFLKPDGFLLMEMGFNQSTKVREMFSREIWSQIEFLPDLQGIPRMVKARTFGQA